MKTKYKWPGAKPPIPEIKPRIRSIHGDEVIDNYYWMIDFFKKGPDSSQVISYLELENEYLNIMMEGTKKIQADLFMEMKNRIKEKDESVPVFKNGYYYYIRTEEHKQYYKYCRKKDLEEKEEILLDVDAMAEGHSYYSLTGFQVSPDNNLLAFAVDTVSRRQYTIQIKDLTTGELFTDSIASTNGNMVWANDNKTLFYTANNPKTLLSEKIKKHILNTEETTDEVVYEEKDKSNYIGVQKSKNEKYILIISRATLSSEIFYIDAAKPASSFKSFQPRIEDVLYEVISLDDKFLILTNWNAKNFRLMECPLIKTDKENWKDLISHRSDVLLSGVEEFKNFMVLSERKNGLVQIRIINLTNAEEHYINFGEPAYMASTGGSNPEYNSTSLRYNYSSLITPASVFDYNMFRKTRKLLKQQEVVGGYSAANYETERLYATTTDRTKIPVSLVYKKGFKKDGNSPLLLYAYGSYGHSMDAAFNSSRLSLLNRGFAFAIAHIRGGQEMGRYWYEEGKMMKKKNTFTDFIDAAKFLIKEKYTSRKHLYAQGGSAGGLLMGAVVNMAPDLWNGIIAQVPFVDVVNTMLDESIPLTTNEFDEWGNPQNEEAYLYMKSYSPYENIERKKYPNILVTTGLHDSQVQHFEPAKWVAKLRAMKTDNNILLLHTNMEFGHGGASGRFDYLKDVALNYAFLFALEGITK